MAVINFLHWNIETLSNNKINDGNGAQIIDYIAAVSAHLNANMISIIEVKSLAAVSLSGNLTPALQAANNNMNDWNAIVSTRTQNSEAYYLLWQAGNNFTSTPSAVMGGPDPIQGFTQKNANPPPNYGRFPSPGIRSGGRRPYFAAFHTTDTNKTFSVLLYHAMFGKWSAVGVRSMGLLQAIHRIDDGAGAMVNLDASIVAGDFNVGLIEFPRDYDNLIHNVSAPAIDPAKFIDEREAKTTLINVTPPVPFNNSLDYRKHAYDNIFGRNVAASNNAAVTDLLVDSAILGGVVGPLVPTIGKFQRRFIRNQGQLNNAPPPQDLEDSWHIVKDQVSNHLPVSVSLTI